VLSADLDGDGDEDVLAGSQSSGSSTVQWFENISPGVFGPGQQVNANGDVVREVDVSDLNGDDTLDILVTYFIADRITWIENLGAGSFATEQEITSETDRPDAVGAADLDGDGDADVLSVSSDDDKLSWYENLSPGVFGPQQVISTEGDYPVDLNVSDVDGDGDVDVLVANFGSSSIVLHENLFYDQPADDCNENGIPDVEEIENGTEADCDGDSILDSCEIAAGAADQNQNGVPDSCEFGGETFCTTSPNSAGPGALIGYGGSLDIQDDACVLTVSGCPPGTIGVFFRGTGESEGEPFGDGVRCVFAGTSVLVRHPVIGTDAQGNTGMQLDFTHGTWGGGGAITPGSTWNFQFWYRDVPAAASGFNLSDALRLTFAP